MPKRNIFPCINKKLFLLTLTNCLCGGRWQKLFVGIHLLLPPSPHPSPFLIFALCITLAPEELAPSNCLESNWSSWLSRQSTFPIHYWILRVLPQSAEHIQFIFHQIFIIVFFTLSKTFENSMFFVFTLSLSLPSLYDFWHFDLDIGKTKFALFLVFEATFFIAPPPHFSFFCCWNCFSFFRFQCLMFLVPKIETQSQRGFMSSIFFQTNHVYLFETEVSLPNFETEVPLLFGNLYWLLGNKLGSF